MWLNTKFIVMTGLQFVPTIVLPAPAKGTDGDSILLARGTDGGLMLTARGTDGGLAAG